MQMNRKETNFLKEGRLFETEVPSFFSIPTTSLLLSPSFLSISLSSFYVYIYIFIPFPVSASKGRGEIPLDYSGKIRSSGKEGL